MFCLALVYQVELHWLSISHFAMSMPYHPRHYQAPSLVPSTQCLPVSTQPVRRHRLCTSVRNRLAEAAATVIVTSSFARPLIWRRTKRVAICLAKLEDEVQNVGEAQQKLGEAQAKLEVAQQELKTAQQELKTAQQELKVTRRALMDATLAGNPSMEELLKKEVTDAERAVTNAERAVTNAERAVTNAEMAVADARKLRDYLLNPPRTAEEAPSAKLAYGFLIGCMYAHVLLSHRHVLPGAVAFSYFIA
jgi:hypothetical protein